VRWLIIEFHASFFVPPRFWASNDANNEAAVDGEQFLIEKFLHFHKLLIAIEANRKDLNTVTTISSQKCFICRDRGMAKLIMCRRDTFDSFSRVQTRRRREEAGRKVKVLCIGQEEVRSIAAGHLNRANTWRLFWMRKPLMNLTREDEGERRKCAKDNHKVNEDFAPCLEALRRFSSDWAKKKSGIDNYRLWTQIDHYASHERLRPRNSCPNQPITNWSFSGN
jgi:hypothetical protein